MQGLKEALLNLIGKGDLKIQLPDAVVEDGFRRNRKLFSQEIRALLRDGEFPYDRVKEVMEDHKDSWLDALKFSLQEYIDSKRILKTSVQFPDGKKVDAGLQHRQFGEVLTILEARQNPYMAGPAGAGKTTIAFQAAQTLGRTFRYTGAITSEFKLTGFIDARGQVVRTAFREVYEKGGLFLFDEIDASMPAPVLAFNAAIANGYMDFPDTQVERHKDFLCIAAANTFGVGANRIYVGRNQLDGATLDRFAFVELGYDEDLELELSLIEVDGWKPKEVKKWVAHVQKVRAAVADLEIHHVISPRASIFGASLLKAGMEWDEVVKARLWKGIDDDSIHRITEIVDDEA